MNESTWIAVHLVLMTTIGCGGGETRADDSHEGASADNSGGESNERQEPWVGASAWRGEYTGVTQGGMESTLRLDIIGGQLEGTFGSGAMQDVVRNCSVDESWSVTNGRIRCVVDQGGTDVQLEASQRENGSGVEVELTYPGGGTDTLSADFRPL